MRAALQEAADLIAKIPATHMTYPNSGAVLPTARRFASRAGGEVLLDAGFLAGFGTLTVPRDLWRALGRFAAWVEPALVAEWIRLMRRDAAGQGRVPDEGALAAATTWSDPSRDVAVLRQRALALLGAGEALRCVWSGRRLDAATLDIDHCLPWSAWPCGDLWNLMPAHRRVNQQDKRDRLPGDGLLRAAAEPIQNWWRQAYLDGAIPLLPQRFVDEAAASLPGLADPALALALALALAPEEVFAALQVQQPRLRYDQQVPEWAG